MTKSTLRTYSSAGLFLSLLMAGTFLASCGGNTTQTSAPPPATDTVTTFISDPPTCTPPNGQFKNVWVSITRVRAHISSDAGANDSGWVDLLDLRSSPKQIDLLSLASTTCLLTQLGSTTGLPPGRYQQIRIYLLSNTPGSGEASPSPNNCGANNGFNCMVPVVGGPQMLQLSSEAQTGIKVPPGRISGGAINLQANQAADLNIDFDACSSIVELGNGRFRLKPTLHAGEVSRNTNSLSGRVVDSTTNNPIANAVVLLERPDPDNSNLDRVVAQRVTDTEGKFIFCPLPSGNYDVVVAATTTSNVGVPTTYNATVTLSVPLGTALGDIPLVPEPTTVGTTTVTSSPATISGLLTTTTAATGGSPTSADIQLSALQAVGGGSSLLVTIPSFSGSTPNLATKSAPTGGGSCPAGTNCENYKLFVPASNPQVGTYRASPPTAYTAPASGNVIYWVNARASVPSSAGANAGSPNCSLSSLPSTFDSSTQLTVAPGSTTTRDFNFTGCQ